MSTFDDPNREAVGLAPIWSTGEPPPEPEVERQPEPEPEEQQTKSKSSREKA